MHAYVHTHIHTFPIASEDEHTNSDELAVQAESDAETYGPTIEILSAKHRRRHNSNVRAVAGWRWRKS